MVNDNFAYAPSTHYKFNSMDNYLYIVQTAVSPSLLLYAHMWSFGN